MAVWVFERSGPGGGGRSDQRCDLRVYVTKTKQQPDRLRLGLRMSADVMDLCRWRRGDRVKARFDDSSGRWTITRCDDGTGNSLTGKDDAIGSGSIQFAISNESACAVGLENIGSYACRAVSATSSEAVFERI
jgi:hypothetical protein